MTEKDIDRATVSRASKKTESSEKTSAAKAKEKASGKTSAAKKPAASGKTTAAKKPAASGKTTAAKKPAAKKPAAAKKTSSALRLSAEEKKLIQNYRKCNSVAKMMITAAVEKAAEKYGSDKSDKEDSGSASVPGLESLLNLLGK
ncbi:MAG TPA: histone H1 [Lachnospiraceae bacterium]|nr:histone H1 [Lachnospiraceae bacterium]